VGGNNSNAIPAIVIYKVLTWAYRHKAFFSDGISIANHSTLKCLDKEVEWKKVNISPL